MIYDEGWDLFGYSGWSPQLNAMVVSFRCPAASPLLACKTGGVAPVKADMPCCGTQRIQAPRMCAEGLDPTAMACDTCAVRKDRASHQATELHRGLGNAAQLIAFLAVLLQGH